MKQCADKLPTEKCRAAAIIRRTSGFLVVGKLTKMTPPKLMLPGCCHVNVSANLFEVKCTVFLSTASHEFTGDSSCKMTAVEKEMTNSFYYQCS